MIRPLRVPWALLVALVWSCLAGAASAPAPPNLQQQVGFDQHLGTQLPLDAALTDAAGRRLPLAAWLDGRPTVLAFGYYRCPNLCDAVLQGMAHAVAATGLVPGRDVQVLFVSIDPREGARDAAQARGMLERMQPQAQPARWHFLTGAAADVIRLTTSAGFRYVYDARLGQFAHAAGLVVLSGRGRVAQYLFGVGFAPHALRLALVDASHGAVGTLVDRFVLMCCGYDPSTGRYTVLIGRVMRWLGIGFAVLLGFWLVLLVRRRRRPSA